MCTRCGTLESDWVDPATGRYRDDPPYEAMVFRCHGCVETERAYEEIPAKEKGLRVVLIPVREADEEDD